MILSAHEFLQRGRSRPPTLTTTAGRWSMWARSIKARHGLVAARQRHISMTLFRPSYSLNLSSRRWQMNAWSLFPRINLTVAPLLNRLSPQSFIKRRVETAQSLAARESNRRVEVMRPFGTKIMQSPGAQFGTSAQGRYAEPVRAAQLEWARAVLFGQRKVNERRVDERMASREVVPLSRVFKRAEWGEAQRHRQTTALVREPLGLAQRVKEEKRRVEQQARGATVMQQRTQPRPESFERDEANSPNERRRSGGFDLASDAMAAAARAAPPALNVQQLTDEVIRQIDSRIVAHKERMGKLF
jgi:hypothetical protein